MTLDIGFLGYGLMGKAHANALARLPMFFPDAPRTNRTIIAGRNEEALKFAADRLGFDQTTTDWRKAVDEIDVLYNLAPPNLHLEPSVAALEAGVHVLCEKPLAATVEDAEQMTQTARESDAIAGCAYNYRYVPALQLAKRIVEAGEIGDVRYFRGQYLQDWQAEPDDPWIWRNDAEVAGPGSVADQGSHTLDLARWLVDDIASVSGRLATVIDERPDGSGDERLPVTTDDLFTVLLDFESEVHGIVEGSRVATGHKNTNAIELIGSKGAVSFDCERLNELQVQFEDDRGFQTVHVTGEGDPYTDAWWPPGHGIGWEHTFVHENYEFLAAIDGGGSFEPGFDAALQTQRVVHAIQQSDEADQRVDVG